MGKIALEESQKNKLHQLISEATKDRSMNAVKSKMGVAIATLSSIKHKKLDALHSATATKIAAYFGWSLESFENWLKTEEMRAEDVPLESKNFIAPSAELRRLIGRIEAGLSASEATLESLVNPSRRLEGLRYLVRKKRQSFGSAEDFVASLAPATDALELNALLLGQLEDRQLENVLTALSGWLPKPSDCDPEVGIWRSSQQILDWADFCFYKKN